MSTPVLRLRYDMIRLIREYAYIPITIFLAWVVFFKVIVIGYIPTESMEPNYRADSVFVGTRILDRDNIKRGTPVLFHFGDEVFLKRVIGLPDETVSFNGGYVYINGESLDETEYLNASVCTESGTEVFCVPCGCYLMLGDNRSESYDARYWPDPYTPSEDIVGRILFAIQIK